MKKRSLFCLLLCAMLATGCTSQSTLPETTIETTATRTEAFSDRDFETGYDESKSAVITLSGDSASCPSDAVRIDGSSITITDEGTYILSGTLNDGMIVVDSEKTDKTQLVLNDVTIHSKTSAPIYVKQSDKVFLTLAPDSVNTLSCGESFTAIDENNIDAVIFSKEDLTLNGSGSLTIRSPGGHGIVSKDSLTITGGNYEITSASHALAGKDDVCIAKGVFTLISGKDGIHAENADDAAMGFVFIEGGVFEIASEGDGISASADLQITGGTYSITTGGGSVNAAKQTSDSWGGFGGKRRGSSTKETMAAAESGEDSTSIKGIKASTDLTIRGGSFTIDSADDAVHSNGNLTVTGGTFAISSGDDAIHADEMLAITSGTVTISESYEGLEGLHIDISGGEITLTASDDGLNAAGGTDQSGFGGMRGKDQFGGGRGGTGSSGSGGSITISGGRARVTASGDGIDSNGSITISGGFTTVSGPTQGDTATLDYDSTAVITGGTFIGTGAAGMAQTFSDSEQGVIAVKVGSQNAGTQIILTDSGGKEILTHTPELTFAVVIVSSPDILKGETYTITVGTASGQFAAN